MTLGTKTVLCQQMFVNYSIFSFTIMPITIYNHYNNKALDIILTCHKKIFIKKKKPCHQKAFI